MPKECIFCKIVAKTAKASLKFENEEIMVFEDIKPASTHHYLAIPKEHIENVHSLQTAHLGLLERLVAEGRQVIEKAGGDLNDIRMGFHLPPFNSVGHVHLHLICPASNMSFIHRAMFKPNSWWFVEVSEILGKLSKLAQEEKAASSAHIQSNL
ncbi:adenosine 5'-monophosphoramidase HINT3 [Dendroctonus ponderosae]